MRGRVRVRLPYQAALCKPRRVKPPMFHGAACSGSLSAGMQPGTCSKCNLDINIPCQPPPDEARVTYVMLQVGARNLGQQPQRLAPALDLDLAWCTLG